MKLRKSIIIPLLHFVCIYTLLIVPWPGWNQAYSALFRGIASQIYGGDSGQRNLSFEPLQTLEHRYYTRIVIVNQSLMSPRGGGPIWNLDLDTIEVGWRPTALLIALTVATPTSIRRRFRALFFGLLVEQVFIFWSLGYFIWIESAGVSLVILTPFWKQAAESFADMLKGQLAFVMPILVWIVVVFNRNDISMLTANLRRSHLKGVPQAAHN